MRFNPIAGALVVALAACSSEDSADPKQPVEETRAPVVHIHTGADLTDFDAGWCRGSMIPVQDPVFPTIRRDRFTIDPLTDLVTIPADWIAETKDVRGPELKAAASARLPTLLGKVEELVRPFDQLDFDYFFYLCPTFENGTASAKVYPMFMYLKAAVGELAWPDWLFTDQYLFHEVLHNYVMERVDYTKGTPFLNDLYGKLVVDEAFTAKWMAYKGDTGLEAPEVLALHQTEMISLVLTHVHVYAIMTVSLRALGEDDRLKTIREYETSLASAHPSYVKAWQIVIERENDPAAIDVLLEEAR